MHCTNLTDFSSSRAELAADFQLEQDFAGKSLLHEAFN